MTLPLLFLSILPYSSLQSLRRAGKNKLTLSNGFQAVQQRSFLSSLLVGIFAEDSHEKRSTIRTEKNPKSINLHIWYLSTNLRFHVANCIIALFFSGLRFVTVQYRAYFVNIQSGSFMTLVLQKKSYWKEWKKALFFQKNAICYHSVVADPSKQTWRSTALISKPFLTVSVRLLCRLLCPQKYPANYDIIIIKTCRWRRPLWKSCCTEARSFYPFNPQVTSGFVSARFSQSANLTRNWIIWLFCATELGGKKHAKRI